MSCFQKYRVRSPYTPSQKFRICDCVGFSYCFVCVVFRICHCVGFSYCFVCVVFSICHCVGFNYCFVCVVFRICHCVGLNYCFVCVVFRIYNCVGLNYPIMNMFTNTKKAEQSLLRVSVGRNGDLFIYEKLLNHLNWNINIKIKNIAKFEKSVSQFWHFLF